MGKMEKIIERWLMTPAEFCSQCKDWGKGCPGLEEIKKALEEGQEGDWDCPLCPD